ncbi:hypothetical protein JCM8208_004117 [Rhodotorula glutinis]
MACLASLPPELRTLIVDEAAGPITRSGFAHRRDTLLCLSLVGPLRAAAQECLTRAVRVQSAPHLEAVRARPARDTAHLQLLYLDNSEQCLTAVAPASSLDVATFPALRAVALVLLDDLDLDPLASLPELEDLRLNGCTVTISPFVVFGRLARLDVFYTSAHKEHKVIFISSSCMPSLRHMRSIHHEGEIYWDDEWPYLRPDEDLVQQLVTLEYNYTPAIAKYNDMGDSACRTLYAINLACLPAYFVQATSSFSKVRHVRLEPFDPSNVDPHVNMSDIDENVRRMSSLIGSNASLVVDLRTILLPSSLRDLPALRGLVETVEASSRTRRRAIKIYFSDDSSRDMPLGEPTLFMRLAEQGQLDD